MAQRRSHAHGPTHRGPPRQGGLEVHPGGAVAPSGPVRSTRYYNQLGEGLGVVVPPQVDVGLGQAAHIAFEEVAAAKATYHRPGRRGSEAADAGGRGRCRGGRAGAPRRRSSSTARRRRRRHRRVDARRAGGRRGSRRGPARRSARRPARAMQPITRRGRTVVLGVTGGIAAYKAVEVCRRLVDAGVHVVPVLTDDATRFVGEVTFSALASEPVRTVAVARRRPDPAHQPRPDAPTWSSWRPPRRASSASYAPGSPTGCSPPPCSPPVHR